MSDKPEKPKENSVSKSEGKPNVRFSTFCKKHKIATDAIKWRMAGDRQVRIAVSKEHFKTDGWSLISVGLMFALRELGFNMDVTLRDNKEDIDIIVER